MLSGTSVGNRPEDKDDILVGCVSFFFFFSLLNMCDVQGDRSGGSRNCSICTDKYYLTRL